MHRSIPITPIWRRYQQLRNASQQVRLEHAQRLIEEPASLAEEFAASVAHFASYANEDESFYPPQRAARSHGAGIRTTNDVVLRLAEQRRLTPVDATQRVQSHDAASVVDRVPAHLLACEYVDRELLVQRTRSPAAWEDGSRNVGGLRLDVLLADATDRTPIVGEVKLLGDMDPFFALVQGLACTAHLATHHQYARMQKHLPVGVLPQQGHVPRFDVWILTVASPLVATERGPSRRYLPELHRAAATLAPRLLAQAGLRRSVRRLAAVSLMLNGSGVLTAAVEWAWGAPVE